MLQRVLKYPIDFNKPVTVLMPKGARILSVGWQGEALVAWALVEEGAPPVERHFDARMTGTLLRGFDGHEFVGTAQLDIPNEPQMPRFVIHVFVKPEE